MSMKASAADHELLFNLRVAPDSRSESTLRTWGKSIQKVQSEITSAGAARARDWGESWTKAAASVTASISTFKTKGTQEINRFADVNVMRAKDVEAAWKKAGEATISQSRLGQRGPGGLSGGSAFSISKSGEGINNLLHGGVNVGRGIAYSGLAGEQDSQKILDSLIKIEGYAAGIHGVISMAKGASALGLFGGGGGGAAGMSGFAGPIALALSAVLAGNSIRETYTGEARNHNSQVGYSASALASIGAPIHKYDRWLWGKEHADQNEFIGGAAGLLDSQDRFKSQQRFINQKSGMNAGHLSGFREEASERFASAEEFATKTRRMHAGRGTEKAAVGEKLVLENWNKVLAEMKEKEAEIGRDSMASYSRREAAAKTVKAAEEEIYHVQQNQKDIAAKTAQEQSRFAQIRVIDSQRDLGFAKESMALKFREASLATDRYGSDLAKFGAMDPLQQMRIRGDADAMKGGRANQEQLSRLSQFSQFQPGVEKEYQKRGLAAGGGALFAPERSEMEGLTAAAEASAKNYQDAAKRAADAQKEFAKTQDEAAALLGEIAVAFEQTNESLKDMYRTVQQDIQKAVDDLRGTKRQGDQARKIMTR